MVGVHLFAGAFARFVGIWSDEYGGGTERLDSV